MRQFERAQGRIERRKQHVCGLYIGAGQAIEQRRLSGVGVTDQSHDPIRHPLAAGAMQPPRRLHLPELVFEPRNAFADQPPVGLDLGFAGASHESETATLAFEMGPGSHQAAALIVEVRELDLQRAFLGLGAAAEDFQDQPGAVEHLGVPGLLEIALLNWRERAIHDDELDSLAGDDAQDFLDLALAEIGRRPDLIDRRDQRIHDRQVDRPRQSRGFIESRFRIARPMHTRLRFRIGAAHSQVRADDDHLPGFRFACRPRTVSVPFAIPGFQSTHSQAGASSPPSNN